jgi:hypothetical protein
VTKIKIVCNCAICKRIKDLFRAWHGDCLTAQSGNKCRKKSPKKTLEAASIQALEMIVEENEKPERNVERN